MSFLHACKAPVIATRAVNVNNLLWNFIHLYSVLAVWSRAPLSLLAHVNIGLPEVILILLYLFWLNEPSKNALRH